MYAHKSTVNAVFPECQNVVYRMSPMCINKHIHVMPSFYPIKVQLELQVITIDLALLYPCEFDTVTLVLYKITKSQHSFCIRPALFENLMFVNTPTDFKDPHCEKVMLLKI